MNKRTRGGKTIVQRRTILLNFEQSRTREERVLRFIRRKMEDWDGAKVRGNILTIRVKDIASYAGCEEVLVVAILRAHQGMSSRHHWKLEIRPRVTGTRVEEEEVMLQLS